MAHGHSNNYRVNFFCSLLSTFSVSAAHLTLYIIATTKKKRVSIPKVIKTAYSNCSMNLSLAAVKSRTATKEERQDINADQSFLQDVLYRSNANI
jgi:hypothetical protein